MVHILSIFKKYRNFSSYMNHFLQTPRLLPYPFPDSFLDCRKRSQAMMSTVITNVRATRNGQIRRLVAASRMVMRSCPNPSGTGHLVAWTSSRCVDAIRGAGDEGAEVPAGLNVQTLHLCRQHGFALCDAVTPHGSQYADADHIPGLEIPISSKARILLIPEWAVMAVWVLFPPTGRDV